MTDRAFPSRPGGTAPHVLVEDIAAPVLSDDEHHHLGRVRRLRVGDAVSVTDGRGAWRWCAYGPSLQVEGPIECDPPPAPRLVLAFALVKGQKPELVVQKLTELGIDEIVPFVAERSVVRWDEDSITRHTARLCTVAREAAQQSRRTWFPDVSPIVSFAEVAARPGAVRCEMGGPPVTAEHTIVLVGPEGGWAESETALPSVGLGSTVLRAETAAIAAATLMSDRRQVRPS